MDPIEKIIDRLEKEHRENGSYYVLETLKHKKTAGAIRLLPFNQIADSSAYTQDHLLIPNDY